MRTLGANLWSGDRLLVANARSVFAEDGRLVDDDIRKRLERVLQGFVSFCREKA